MNVEGDAAAAVAYSCSTAALTASDPEVSRLTTLVISLNPAWRRRWHRSSQAIIHTISPLVVGSCHHAISMQSGRDGGLVYESDFLGPEGLERIECFGDLWGSGSVGFGACNPLLVLFGIEIETTAFDDADAQCR